MKRYPKILVGAPVYDGHRYAIERYLRSVKNLSYPNYDIMLVDNSKEMDFFLYLASQKIKVVRSPHLPNPMDRIALARNYIVNYFLDKDYDYLMSIDTDVIIPKDGIERLLKHKKDIVGFLCHMKKPGVPAVLKSGHMMLKGKWGVNHYTWKELKDIKKDLVKVYATSIGCTLIHRKVFESGIRFRYTPSINVGEDMWFFSEANQRGFSFWLDKSVRVKHYNKSRDLRTDETWKQRKMWKKKYETLKDSFGITSRI